jgi:hypothetical protein
VSCGGSDETAQGDGKVRIVYHDIKPENQDAAQLLRDSGVLKEFADWSNRSLALPHDLVVHVTDKVPAGVTDMVTQPAGRTIFIPPTFVKDVQGVNETIVKTVKRPPSIPKTSSTPTISPR